MCRPCTSVLEHPTEVEGIGFHGISKGKSALMIFDKHPEMGNKWNREFWARGYFVATIGYANEGTIKKYIAEQQEESYKEDRAIK